MALLYGQVSFVPQDAFEQYMRALITWPCGTTFLLTPVFRVKTFDFVLWLCQVCWCWLSRIFVIVSESRIFQLIKPFNKVMFD